MKRDRTVTSNIARRRRRTRDRMRQLRERSREHRHDPLSYFHVPLPESVIHILVAELKIKQADDVPVDDRTWRSLVGLVIANVVKSAVGKKL